MTVCTRWWLAAGVLAGAASCATRPPSPAGDAVPNMPAGTGAPVATAPVATAPVAAAPVEVADASCPTATAIAAAERARVGALRTLHARGVAELRWTDPDGNHFEQGDADVRWCAGRGIAASISKFGDRHAWIGSDGTRWWSFSLKAEPTRLVVGTFSAGASGARAMDALVASPPFLGIAPIVPAASETVAVRDGYAWVAVPLDDAVRSSGARADAAFDLRTLEPRRLRVTWPDGASCTVEFGELVSVETPGAAPGAWPRIPRRIVAGRSGDSASLSLAIDSASADPEGADRPALYDLDQLRAKFAPARVEEDR